MINKNRSKNERNLNSISNGVKELDEKSRLCIECRYCCEYVNLPLLQGPGYASFYGSIRGMNLKWRNFMPWVVVKSPCQHLTKDGCAIYTKRPSTCRDYDGRLDLFYPEKCLWNKIKKEGV